MSNSQNLNLGVHLPDIGETVAGVPESGKHHRQFLSQQGGQLGHHSLSQIDSLAQHDDVALLEEPLAVQFPRFTCLHQLISSFC